MDRDQPIEQPDHFLRVLLERLMAHRGERRSLPIPRDDRIGRSPLDGGAQVAAGLAEIVFQAGEDLAHHSRSAFRDLVRFRRGEQYRLTRSINRSAASSLSLSATASRKRPVSMNSSNS